MTTTTNTIANRISELENIMKAEVANNFANGSLWDESNDKIWFLKTYGQETAIENESDADYISQNER